MCVRVYACVRVRVFMCVCICVCTCAYVFGRGGGRGCGGCMYVRRQTTVHVAAVAVAAFAHVDDTCSIRRRSLLAPLSSSSGHTHRC
jgi:hypothetical protein